MRYYVYSQSIRSATRWDEMGQSEAVRKPTINERQRKMRWNGMSASETNKLICGWVSACSNTVLSIAVYDETNPNQQNKT